MDPKFRTSFIPKKTLTTAGVKKPSSSPFGVVILVTFIIFLASIVLSVGVFLYNQILISSIDRKQETLDRASAAFEPSLIQELIRLDSRIKSADDVLNQHITPSSLFEVIEELTLKSVQFKDFSFTRISQEKISISMNGVARNFAGVALQADVFGGDKIIKNPIFSDLNIDRDGNVVFSFTAFVDSSLIRYVNTTNDSENTNNSNFGDN